MYISEPQNGHTTTKYASTNSIPAMMEQESSLARILGAVGRHRENAAILRDTKTRRHSVLEDLKARRDSLIQRARRVSMFEEKENSAKDTAKDNIKIDVKDNNAKEKTKDKRRGSESGRRGSVFYVSQDLLEENQEVLENEDRDRLAQEAKKARRKSWHPLVKPPKLDRKRRKGVVSGVPSEIGSTEGLFSQNYPRQKRPSWWNIFIPESRQVDNAIQTRLPWDFIIFKYVRCVLIHRSLASKSRSVDHGFTAPFDLDALRNKVEGRFESVDKLSKELEKDEELVEPRLKLNYIGRNGY
ncbi:hypothetical protein ALC60_06134 [Trachymyrmex zeteki]|uniref:Uncharacterized protein n=1 Tax=Mycetomoellerius zeteki TaxID=64791 RepID=A0A151X3J0_9HYME|nr:hypothetical protein ALC60_06134 [Trachymyrmex zeteki]